MIRRYDEICRGDAPDLTDAEWGGLVAAGETWDSETDIAAGGRWSRLLDAANRNEHLRQKLLDLGRAHQIAIVDYVERYWTSKARHDPLPPYPVAGAPSGPWGRGRAVKG